MPSGGQWLGTGWAPSRGVSSPPFPMHPWSGVTSSKWICFQAKFRVTTACWPGAWVRAPPLPTPLRTRSRPLNPSPAAPRATLVSPAGRAARPARSAGVLRLPGAAAGVLELARTGGPARHGPHDDRGDLCGGEGDPGPPGHDPRQVLGKSGFQRGGGGRGCQKSPPRLGGFGKRAQDHQQDH